MTRLLVLVGVVGVASGVLGDVRLPRVFSDGMVLQREGAVKVWGTADAGEEVSVRGSWGRSASVTAGADGTWSVNLGTGRAGGPYTLTVTGKNSVSFDDVLLGEVWLCSGQSNMEWPLGHPSVVNTAAEVAAANHPQIRLLQVPRKHSPTPLEDQDATWQVCTPESAKGFSAVGYFFARELQRKLNVPVGVINASFGGTAVELWMSEAASGAIPAGTNRSTLYNAMIEPVLPYGIRGALWYQGESNVGNAGQYLDLFSTMVTDWRTKWGRGDFPFYTVQIAPYRGYGGGRSQLLREAQLQALRLKNSGMVVTTDITSNLDDIHPGQKFEVGERLSRWALDRVYGVDTVVSGPLYRSMKREGRRVRLAFDYADRLTERDALGGFEIAGADRKFVKAYAKIDGDSVVVWSDEVSEPVAVRYGWSNVPPATLFNGAGLPASPFRTDSWPE